MGFENLGLVAGLFLLAGTIALYALGQFGRKKALPHLEPQPSVQQDNEHEDDLLFSLSQKLNEEEKGTMNDDHMSADYRALDNKPE